MSYVRVGDKWFSCNDESVTPVAAHVVLKESAYQLFYQRQVPRDVPAKPAGATPRASTPRAATPKAAALVRCVMGGWCGCSLPRVVEEPWEHGDLGVALSIPETK